MKKYIKFSLGIFVLCILPSSPAVAAQERSLTDVNMRFLEQKTTTNRWGRDPFLLPLPVPVLKEPEVVVGETQESLLVSAIIYRGEQGVAIINNRIVRKGDRIEGMEVYEIFSDRILLKEGSRVMELKVHQFLSK